MKPEHAVALRAFDYLAAVTFGVVAAVAASYLVPAAFPAPLAMVLGMVIGAVAAFPLLGLFTFLLGGFEILVMSLQTGMLAGMVGAMVGGAALASVAVAGAAAGLGVQLLLHLADRSLRGEVSAHE